VEKLGPKHDPFKKVHVSASREFTDREEPTRAFLNAFEQKSRDEYKVLTYYGVGGIGKSRLLSELYGKMAEIDSGAVKLLHDFKEEKHRNPGEALISLREQMRKKHKVKFPTFDLAYTVYWRKLHPQLSMKANRNELPFIEEGSFVADLIEQLDYVPFAQWVPKTLKLINGVSRYKDVIQWWHGRGKQVMEQLEELLPNQIEELLPAFFAADLKEYLESTGKKAVYFLDTYEALWAKNRLQGAFHEKDDWVQELVLQLPEVLWVIAGREKIHWADVQEAWKPYLEQHLIGELSDKDCGKFLTACGIRQEEVKQVIIQGSRGLPYYLDLMVDTFTVIRQKREPVPADFSKTPQKIMNRFLQYLDLYEKETLKILSFVRFWDESLFVRLVSEFKTGYPVYAYNDLFRFSFINSDENKTWNMNAIMRTSLQEDVKRNNPYLYQQAHEHLFAFYDEKLRSAEVGRFLEEDKQAAREAYYHAKIIKTTADFLEWFLETGKKLQASGQFELVSSFYEDVVKLLPEENSEQAAFVHQYFGEIGLLQGNYDKAVEELQTALGIYANLPGCTMNRTKCYSDLAEIMIHTTEYEQAYSYLSKAAADYQEESKKERTLLLEHALLCIRLGKLDIRFSNYEESMNHYQKAISLCKQALELSSEDFKAFGTMALAYEKLGELYGSQEYVQQGKCYRQSIQYYEQALSMKEDLRTLTNMGLAYKRLAEHYDAKTEPVEKMKSFERAISIYNQVLQQSPDFIDALEKKGHATVDYMALQIELGQYERAVESFADAVDAFEAALELSPRQSGSKNRIGSAHRELAEMYMKKGQYDEALAHLQTSLDIYEELRNTSDYIYVDNSIGKTQEMLGDFYRMNSDTNQANIHYQLAIQSFENMLKRAPKLLEPIERIANIQAK
jgi:tetratricopeptide (TPR) repeat protein